MTDEPSRDRPALVPHGTLLPPAPPGVRYVPVVFVGIVVADDHLRRRVDRFFHWPMIVLALAILPLLVIELVRRPEGWLARTLEIGFAIIWLAFVLEFLIKIAVAESRAEYVRRNWFDLVIICVPILRPLRAKAAIARTANAAKLRGVGMKLARYVFTIFIGMEASDRLLRRAGLRATKARRDPHEMTRHQLMSEVASLRRRVDAWEAWHEDHETFVRERGGPCRIDRPEDAEPERGAIEEPLRYD